MNFITVEGIQNQNQNETKLWLKEDNIIFIQKNKIREDYVLYYKITEKEWNTINIAEKEFKRILELLEEVKYVDKE